MQYYSFVSKVGVFTIRPQRDGFWSLWIGSNVLGEYHSPEAAADDVCMQNTGCFEWDDSELDLLNIPTDLNEWEMTIT